MRKVLFFMMTSLDGYYEGAKPWELDWHHVDGEFNEFAVAQMAEADTFLFGRKTYEGMAAYWPTEQSVKDSPRVAKIMNETPKVVFSQTLEKADWQNTRLVKTVAAEEVKKLKDQSGKDLLIIGSSDLTVSLMKYNLVDEFRVMVNPVVLGKGKPLFAGLPDRYSLKLLKTRTFKSGNALLYYRPDGK